MLLPKPKEVHYIIVGSLGAILLSYFYYNLSSKYITDAGSRDYKDI